MHPLHQFEYCPKCGAKAFVEHNEKAKQCTACKFVYYFNPSSAVACFIRNPKGELLLVRRAKEPAKGTLDLPGGFVDMYESAEEAARREVKEETGLDIAGCRYLFSIPIPVSKCIRSTCFSNARPNLLTGQRPKMMQPRSLSCPTTN